MQAGQFLAGTACTHNLVRHAVKISQRVRSCILQHELKSAESAHTVDGRRLKETDKRAGNHESFGREVGDDVRRGVAFAAALISRFGGEKIKPAFEALPEKLKPITAKGPSNHDSAR